MDTLALLIYGDNMEDLADLELTLDLPAGVEYAGYVASHYANGNATEFDVVNLGKPVFLLDSLRSSDVFAIYIGVQATTLVQPTAGTLKPEYEIEFTYINDSNIPLECSATYTPEADLNSVIRVPVLNMLSVTPATRTITLKNTDGCQDILLSQDGIQAYVDNVAFQIQVLRPYESVVYHEFGGEWRSNSLYQLTRLIRPSMRLFRAHLF